MGWMEKICELITFFTTITFDHIYREENEEENILSKKTLQVPEGRIHFSKWKDGHVGLPLSLRL